MVGPAHNFNLKHRGLQGDFRPSGGTDLPHAMQTALAGMKEYNEKVKQKHKNAVVQWLVVLTDGDTSSLRLTREQTIAMLQEASHSVWNFKVCFIGIGQSASETAVLQEMAAAVKDRLRTPGGIVCATQGTDIASMRKVFQEASTMVRKIQDKLVVEKGNEKIIFRGQAAQKATQHVLAGGALGQLSLGGGSGASSQHLLTAPLSGDISGGACSSSKLLSCQQRGTSTGVATKHTSAASRPVVSSRVHSHTSLGTSFADLYSSSQFGRSRSPEPAQPAQQDGLSWVAIALIVLALLVVGSFLA